MLFYIYIDLFIMLFKTVTNRCIVINQYFSTMTLPQIIQQVISEDRGATTLPEIIEQVIAAESPAVAVLREDTNPEIIQEVTDYVLGKLQEETIFAKISPQTSYAYLAAAKIVDLTIPFEEQTKTTWKVRERCFLQKAPTGDPDKKQITMGNAFVMPAPHQTNIHFLNRFDNTVPTMLENPPLSVEMKVIGRKECTYHPDAISRIQNVVRKVFAGVRTASEALSGKRTIYVCGPMGGGKTHAVQQLILGNPELREMGAQKAVYSTDNIKTLLGEEFPESGDQQRFFLGLIIRQELEKTLKEQLHLSLIQEAIISGKDDVDAILSENTPAHDLREMDADDRVLLLRVLGRERKYNFNTVKKFAMNTRKTRPYLLEKLREQDLYSLTYVHKDGSVSTFDHATAKDFPSQKDEAVFNAVGRELISQEDVSLYGKDLAPYVGWTIQAALDEAARQLGR